MDSWAKDWDNPEDAVYDKIRSSVITAKEKFEAPIRADERKQVIKLLENLHTEAAKSVNYAFTGNAQARFVWMAEAYAEAIALIKGEK